MRSFEANGLLGPVRLYRQVPADDDELATVHSRPYLARLAEMDARGEGMVDGRQTPAYTGMLLRARLAVGGTVLGTRLVLDHRAAHVFNPGGGLHHAHADRASGFCLLNDVAVAVRHAEDRYGVRRVAILDVDAHHGDGNQDLLSDRALVVSVHEYGVRFFPGTGAAEDPGLGLAVNLPLARGDGDDAMRSRLTRAEAAIRAFRPELLVLQFGTDAHAADPFAHLEMTDAAYREIGLHAHALAHELCGGRLVVVGGGGYEPVTVARLWTSLLTDLLA